MMVSVVMILIANGAVAQMASPPGGNLPAPGRPTATVKLTPLQRYYLALRGIFVK